MYLAHPLDNASYKNIPKTITKKSYVPATDLTFVGTSELDIQNTAMKLEKHLIQLMKENFTERKLNKQETYAFRVGFYLFKITCVCDHFLESLFFQLLLPEGMIQRFIIQVTIVFISLYNTHVISCKMLFPQLLYF